MQKMWWFFLCDYAIIGVSKKAKGKDMKKQTIFEIMAIILIAIFCISITPKTLQNDTFYTIKIGEHIIENGGIDMMDPFSWHVDLEYTYPHWLYDVITYEIYNIGGITGIYISTCIFAMLLGISLYKISSKLTQNKTVSFFTTIAAIYMLRDYITARAQLVTFILFISQIFFMEKLVDTKQKRYAIGLIIVSILIANLHVAVWPFMFVLYLPYIAEYMISILEEKNAKKYNKQIEDGYKVTIEKKIGIKYLAIVMLICVLTGFLTPLGPTTPYTYLIKTMQGNTTHHIGEHLPMTIMENIDVLCAIIIFLAVLTFTDSKIRLVDLIMISGLALLMFYSKRQVTMFVLAGTIILNRVLYNWMKKYEKDIDYKMINVFTTKMGAVLLSLIVISLSLYFALPKMETTYIDETEYPVQMSDFMLQYFEENKIDIKDVRLYNEYNYGSYLLYRGIPVFIDSRCDLYTPQYNQGRDIFTDFVDSSKINMWFEEIFEEYGITHIILSKDSKMNMIIEDAELEGYNLLKEDENFAFYEYSK